MAARALESRRARLLGPLRLPDVEHGAPPRVTGPTAFPESPAVHVVARDRHGRRRRRLVPLPIVKHRAVLDGGAVLLPLVPRSKLRAFGETDPLGDPRKPG